MGDVVINRCTLRVVRHGGWGWGPEPRKLLQGALAALPWLIARELGRLWPDDFEGEFAAPVTIRVPLSMSELLAAAGEGSDPNSVETSPLTQALSERIGTAARAAFSAEQAGGVVPPESREPRERAGSTAGQAGGLTLTEPEEPPCLNSEVNAVPDASAGGAVAGVLLSWHEDGVLTRRLAAFSLTALEAWLGRLTAEGRSPREQKPYAERPQTAGGTDPKSKADIHSVPTGISGASPVPGGGVAYEAFERFIHERARLLPGTPGGRAAALRRLLIVLTETLAHFGLRRCTPAVLAALEKLAAEFGMTLSGSVDFLCGIHKLSTRRRSSTQNVVPDAEEANRATLSQGEVRSGRAGDALNDDAVKDAMLHDSSSSSSSEPSASNVLKPAPVETRQHGAPGSLIASTLAHGSAEAAGETSAQRVLQPLRNGEVRGDDLAAAAEGRITSAKAHRRREATGDEPAGSTPAGDTLRASRGGKQTSPPSSAAGELASPPPVEDEDEVGVEAKSRSAVRGLRKPAARRTEFSPADSSAASSTRTSSSPTSAPRTADRVPSPPQLCPTERKLAQDAIATFYAEPNIKHCFRSVGQSSPPPLSSTASLRPVWREHTVRIPSALPFLLLGPLSYAGYVRALAATLDAADSLEAAPLFATALAYKVLAPPALGWRRAPGSVACAAAFAALEEPAAEPALVGLARHLPEHLSPLEAALTGALVRGHKPEQPILLMRTGADAGEGYLLVDVEGMFPVRWAASAAELHMTLSELDSSIFLIPQASAADGLLKWMDEEGFRFITDAAPTRGEFWRSLRGSPRERWWTNETITADPALVRAARALRDAAEEAATVWEELHTARPSIPLADDAALERHLTLAASTALGTIALELWREREPTAPHLALQRFGDLEARVFYSRDAVRVSLPLGKRSRDLLDHGLLDDVAGVPWFGGRVLTFTTC